MFSRIARQIFINWDLGRRKSFDVNGGDFAYFEILHHSYYHHSRLRADEVIDNSRHIVGKPLRNLAKSYLLVVLFISIAIFQWLLVHRYGFGCSFK